MNINITRSLVVKVLLLLILGLVVFLFVFHMKSVYDIIYPFIISAFFAYLLHPLVCRIEQSGIKRTVSILIIYGILSIVIFFICFFLIPVVVRDLMKLTGVVPDYIEKVNRTVQYIQDKYSKSGLPDGIKNAVDSNIKRIEDSVTLYIDSALALILGYISKAFSFALVPVLLYYFLKDSRSIGRKSKMMIPRKYRGQMIRIFSSIDEVFGSYIRCQILLSLIIAVMTSGALFLLKIDFALVIGIINGITNIIPYFGPIIGAVPAILLAMLQSPMKAVYTMVLMIIIQQVESDIISPKITAGSVGLHPMTVILALLIGGKYFGVMGLILAVPVAAALKVIYKDVMKNLF